MTGSESKCARGNGAAADDSCGELDSRDDDLSELHADWERWSAGEISEDEYIDHAVAIMMRKLDGFPLTAAEREDILSAMRFTYMTSPRWRLALHLDPFPEEG